MNSTVLLGISAVVLTGESARLLQYATADLRDVPEVTGRLVAEYAARPDVRIEIEPIG
jgi:hypothetical protein